jgi:hypothetical protein
MDVLAAMGFQIGVTIQDNDVIGEIKEVHDSGVTLVLRSEPEGGQVKVKIQSLLQREWKEGVCEAQATDAGGVGDRSTPYLCRVSDHGAEGQCCGCYVQAGQGLTRMDDCAAVD